MRQRAAAAALGQQPAEPATSPARRRRAAVTVFAFAALVYALIAPGHLGTVDMRSELAVSQAMVDMGDVTVASQLPYVTVTSVTGADGRQYSVHGVGQSILLLPAALVGRAAGCGASGCPPMAQHDAEFAASFLDGLVSALAVSLLFLLALDLGAGMAPALALALIYAFTTVAFAYAHDAFDVAPTTTAILLAVFAVHRGVSRASPAWLAVSGAAIGFAVLLRDASAICVPILGVYAALGLWRDGRGSIVRAAAAFAAPICICLLIDGVYNWVRFGDPLQSGYGLASDYYGFSLGALPAGVAGLLLSPGRSILLYSPVLLAALTGVGAFWRRHRAVAAMLIALVLCNLVFYGAYSHWWGDWAWGPRFLVPMTPFILLPLLPFLERWRRLSRRARVAIVGLASAGLVVQLLDVGLDFQHQIELLVESGVPSPDAANWTIQDVGLWRHAASMVGLITGSAPYPASFAFTDLTTFMPRETVFDVWWVYAFMNGANPLVVGTVLGLSIGWVTWLVSRLRFAVLSARAHGASSQAATQRLMRTVLT